MTNCHFCGKEIHFDPNIKSKRGKYMPLSGKTETSKHRCSARPFNKQEGNGGGVRKVNDNNTNGDSSKSKKR